MSRIQQQIVHPFFHDLQFAPHEKEVKNSLVISSIKNIHSYGKYESAT